MSFEVKYKPYDDVFGPSCFLILIILSVFLIITEENLGYPLAFLITAFILIFIHLIAKKKEALYLFKINRFFLNEDYIEIFTTQEGAFKIRWNEFESIKILKNSIFRKSGYSRLSHHISYNLLFYKENFKEDFDISTGTFKRKQLIQIIGTLVKKSSQKNKIITQKEKITSDY